MRITLFLLILGIIATIDYDVLLVPNLLVLPGIVLGLLLTGNYLPVLVSLVFGFILRHYRRIGGGDAKILGLGASFLGWLAVPVYIASYALVFLYRFIKKDNNALAYGPFYFFGSILVIATNQMAKWLVV